MAKSNGTSAVVSQARKQIEGIKSRPDLEKGLVKPLATVEAQFAMLAEAIKAQDELKKAAVVATEAVRKAAFELRVSVRSNIQVAVRRRGRYNPDLVLLGGKPRANGRRSVDETA